MEDFAAYCRSMAMASEVDATLWAQLAGEVELYLSGDEVSEHLRLFEEG